MSRGGRPRRRSVNLTAPPAGRSFSSGHHAASVSSFGACARPEYSCGLGSAGAAARLDFGPPVGHSGHDSASVASRAAAPLVDMLVVVSRRELARELCGCARRGDAAMASSGERVGGGARHRPPRDALLGRRADLGPRLGRRQIARARRLARTRPTTCCAVHRALRQHRGAARRPLGRGARAGGGVARHPRRVPQARAPRVRRLAPPRGAHALRPARAAAERPAAAEPVVAAALGAARVRAAAAPRARGGRRAAVPARAPRLRAVDAPGAPRAVAPRGAAAAARDARATRDGGGGAPALCRARRPPPRLGARPALGVRRRTSASARRSAASLGRCGPRARRLRSG